ADGEPRDARGRRRHREPRDERVGAGEHRLAVDRSSYRTSGYEARVVENGEVDRNPDSRQAGENRKQLHPRHYFRFFSRLWIVALEHTSAGLSPVTLHTA